MLNAADFDLQAVFEISSQNKFSFDVSVYVYVVVGVIIIQLPRYNIRRSYDVTSAPLLEWQKIGGTYPRTKQQTKFTVI